MSSQDDCSTGNCPNNECFDIVKSKKTVTVPCTRNICESYTVKVPKTKAVTVNKEVPYIDYESRTKQVPYQYFERQTVVRKVPTCRTVPVTKNVCTTVRRKPMAAFLSGGRSCVTKKCPRTVYVTQRCCVPRQFCKTVPRTGWKTVQEQVPVQKMKKMPEVQYKTEYVPEVRRRTRQVTKMVTKTVPVYNIVPKPPASPGKDRVIKTVPAPETNLVQPVPLVCPVVGQSNAVQTAAVQTAAVQTAAVPVNAYYYPSVQQAVYEPRPQVAYVPSPQVRYIRRNDNLEQSLGFEEVQLNPAMTNGMAAINTNYESGYGVQETERLDSYYQGRPSVMYETPVRNTEAALTYSDGADAGAEFGQRL